MNNTLYEEIILGKLGKIQNCELISNQNNVVYRLIKDDIVYYVKFYTNYTMHQDNECLLYNNATYDLLKYMKEVVCEGNEGNMHYAVYKEIDGDMLCDLLHYSTEKNKISSLVAHAFKQYTQLMYSMESVDYGFLRGSFTGSHKEFIDFLWEYQHVTTKTLLKNDVTKEYAALPYHLISQYYELLDTTQHGVVPIDNNFKNIIICGETVKFIDPGSIISGPIEMAYGEFVAHAYGTEVFDEFVKIMNFDNETQKRIRIYAILSCLNILAFLVRTNTNSLDKMTPFGNDKPFFEQILEHMMFLNER